MQVSGFSVTNFTVGLTDVDLDVVFSVILVSVLVSVLVDSRRMLFEVGNSVNTEVTEGVEVCSVCTVCMYGVTLVREEGEPMVFFSVVVVVDSRRIV